MDSMADIAFGLEQAVIEAGTASDQAAPAVADVSSPLVIPAMNSIGELVFAIEDVPDWATATSEHEASLSATINASMVNVPTVDIVDFDFPEGAFDNNPAIIFDVLPRGSRRRGIKRCPSCGAVKCMWPPSS